MQRTNSLDPRLRAASVVHLGSIFDITRVKSVKYRWFTRQVYHDYFAEIVCRLKPSSFKFNAMVKWHVCEFLFDRLSPWCTCYRSKGSSPSEFLLVLHVILHALFTILVPQNSWCWGSWINWFFFSVSEYAAYFAAGRRNHFLGDEFPFVKTCHVS